SIWLQHATDYVTGADFSVHRCAKCGFGRTEPRPESMEPFYPVRYRKYGPLTKTMLRTLYGWRVRSWVKHLPDRGKALEIGCGAGWMLAVLRDRGWDVIGTERSDEETIVATETTGIPILK